MSCGLHNSPRSSHLSPIAVGMAKVLVRTVVVETVKEMVILQYLFSLEQPSNLR